MQSYYDLNSHVKGRASCQEELIDIIELQGKSQTFVETFKNKFILD
jgi:hypothetical protein